MDYINYLLLQLEPLFNDDMLDRDGLMLQNKHNERTKSSLNIQTTGWNGNWDQHQLGYTCFSSIGLLIHKTSCFRIDIYIFTLSIDLLNLTQSERMTTIHASYVHTNVGVTVLNVCQCYYFISMRTVNIVRITQIIKKWGLLKF